MKLIKASSWLHLVGVAAAAFATLWAASAQASVVSDISPAAGVKTDIAETVV